MSNADAKKRDDDARFTALLDRALADRGIDPADFIDAEVLPEREQTMPGFLRVRRLSRCPCE